MVSSCQNGFSCIQGTCQQQIRYEVDQGINITESICICNQGWENDNSLFHQSNCALPNNALLGFLILALITILPTFGLFARATLQAKGTARTLGVSVMVSMFILLVSSISMYLENGMFEVTSFFMCINNVSVNVLSSQLTILNLRTILMVHYRGNVREICQKFKSLMYLFQISFVIMGVVMAINARSSKFNYFVVALLCMMMATIIICSAYQYRFSSTLMGILDRIIGDKNDSNEIGSEQRRVQREIFEAKNKLMKMRTGTIIFAISALLNLGAIVGVFIGLQMQLPFAWCLLLLVSVSQQIKFYVCLVMIQRIKTRTGESDDAPENTNIVIIFDQQGNNNNKNDHTHHSSILEQLNSRNIN